MKNPFKPGDQKVFETKVTEGKLAQFDTGIVHPVYSTFALGKDVEWACRLFVLEMKEEGEEGIGTFLSIEHLYPSPLGSAVIIEATLQEVVDNEVICNWFVFSNGMKIAQGKQIQKIINKEKFNSLIKNIIIK